MRSQKVSKSGFEEVRIGVFHVECNAARKIDTTKKHFIHFLRLCLDYQVDIIGGDANRAAYTAYQTQSMWRQILSIVSSHLRCVKA